MKHVDGEAERRQRQKEAADVRNKQEFSSEKALRPPSCSWGVEECCCRVLVAQLVNAVVLDSCIAAGSRLLGALRLLEVPPARRDTC